MIYYKIEMHHNEKTFESLSRMHSLVTNRDKKFCDADTLTEEMKELLIEKILVYSNNVLEIYWKADFIKYFSDTSRIIGKETGKNE